MPALASALKEEQWQVAALILVRAMLAATLRIPEDAIPQLLETLEGDHCASEG